MFNLLKLIGFDDACFHTLKLCNAYLFFIVLIVIILYKG